MRSGPWRLGTTRATPSEGSTWDTVACRLPASEAIRSSAPRSWPGWRGCTTSKTARADFGRCTKPCSPSRTCGRRRRRLTPYTWVDRILGLTTDFGVEFAAELCVTRAELALGQDQPVVAVEVTSQVLAQVIGTDEERLAPRLLVLGMRGCADLAEAAAARSDATGLAAARTRAVRCATWLPRRRPTRSPPTPTSPTRRPKVPSGGPSLVAAWGRTRPSLGRTPPRAGTP